MFIENDYVQKYLKFQISVHLPWNRKLPNRVEICKGYKNSQISDVLPVEISEVRSGLSSIFTGKK